MTSRERWTVYPLLFLSLGLAVRSIVVPSGEFLAARVDDLECIRLTCGEIVVVDDQDTILVHIGKEAAADDAAIAGAGRIELHNSQGEVTRWISGTVDEPASAPPAPADQPAG
jgi:hypothetical protein